MNYTVYADSYLLFPDENATDVRLKMALNQAGQLSFVLYEDHPNFTRPEKLKSVIKVYRDIKLIWTGRVVNTEQIFDNSVGFVCEGYLATLNDSVLRPFTFDGTVTEYLQMVLTNHNTLTGKNLLLGTVGFTDTIQRSASAHITTWEAVKGHLLDILGGYFQIRYSGNDIYLDYHQTISGTSGQVIEYGENLQDLQNIIDAMETYTAIMPLGAEIATGEDESGAKERLTIASVNGGVDYITNPTYTALYGVIFAPPEDSVWDDVTVADNLLDRAEVALAEGIKLKQEIKIQAVDLAYIQAVDAFEVGENILVSSTPHGISEEYLLEELDIDITRPEATTITLGKSKTTITDILLGEKDRTQRAEDYIERIIKDYVVNDQLIQVYSEMTATESSIVQTASEIIMTVLGSYVTTAQLEQYKTDVATRFTQTENAFGFEFETKTVSEFVSEITGALESGLALLTAYVRIVDGVIYIGRSDSEVSVVIDNDSFEIKRNGLTVMSITADKIDIRYADIATQADIGSFGFIPRADGNLSFKKIT